MDDEPCHSYPLWGVVKYTPPTKRVYWDCEVRGHRRLVEMEVYESEIVFECQECGEQTKEPI